MIYIEKSDEPEWLMEFKRNNPGAEYDSPAFAEYKLRLRQNLVMEQKYLCAYCCGRISVEQSHNEHIEPRHPGTYSSKKSLQYSNLVASCGGFKGEKTCGKHKDRKYDEKQFISPLTPECEEVFTYYPDGVVDGNKYTVDLLNLNSYALRNARKAVYKMMMKFADIEMIKEVYLDAPCERLEPFTNVILWYIKENR